MQPGETIETIDTGSDLLSVTVVRPGLCRVVWSGPAANALSAQMIDALFDAFDVIQDRHDVRVVLLAGAGGRFSSGFDLRGDPDDAQLAWTFARCEQLLAHVRSFPKVTVASVSGPAYGAGADLAASCDYRIGTADARFRFPGARFGIVLGTGHLAAVVGRQSARDILLRNRVVDADTAVTIGLLNAQVVADQHLMWAVGLATDVASIDAQALPEILQACRLLDPTADLSRLVLSATRPGLARRIERFAASSIPTRRGTPQ